MADGLLNKASIILTPTGYKAGTLYNVAPVLEPYEDFDFARASVASRVNSSGLVEMVGRTLSSELMPSVATIVNLLGGSITQISSNSYSSTSDGTTGSSLRPKFDFNTTSGKTYKLVITPTGAITGTLNFDFYDGSSYLFQNYDFTTTKEIYFTDNGSVFGGFDGTKTYSIASFTISVKEVIDTNNIPRISYDSNGANGHILLEPTSTNLVTYSQEFGSGKYFNVNQATLASDNNLAPDGTNTATQLLSTGAGKLQSSSVTLPANTTYTLSFFAKNVDATEVQSRVLALGGSGGTNLTSVSYFSQINTTTFTRITHIFTTNSTEENYILYISNVLNSGGNIQLWGAQLEELSYATSYIPSLIGSTVTRATETATGAGSATLINSTEGVLYAEIAALDDGISQQIGVYGNSTTKQLRIEIANSVIRAQLFNGAYQANMSSTQTVTNFNKIAFLWKLNDFALWINGVEVATDSSGSTFPANDLDRLNLSGQNGVSSLAQAKIKAIAVFNEALSDAELNNLTG